MQNTFNITCSDCQSTLQLEGDCKEWEGKTIQCPKCHTQVAVDPNIDTPAPKQQLKVRKTEHTSLSEGDVEDRTQFLPPSVNRWQSATSASRSKTSNASQGVGAFIGLIMKLLVLGGVAVGIYFIVKNVDIKSFLSKDADIIDNERTKEAVIATSQSKDAGKQMRQEELELEQERQAGLIRKEREKQTRQTQIQKQERYQVLVNECLKKFREPALGTKITLRLKNGSTMEGIIKRITENMVEFQKGSAAITLKKSQLSPKTCRQLYAVDYAEYWAMKQLHKEFGVP